MGKYLALPGLLASQAVEAAPLSYPWQPNASYDLSAVDQFAPTPAADVVPADPEARAAMARALAMEAVTYGFPSVLQYREMYQQAMDPASPRYVGFNRFAHDRDLAGPAYRAFKTPNSDTLYSNAWLDLTDGPVLIDIPAIPLRYYTLNFLDMYSNASNIGTRTFGSRGGRYLVAPVTWKGTVPDGATLFRVATPQMWVLMRLFPDNPANLALVRAIQDKVRITPLGRGTNRLAAPRPGQPDDPESFLAVLDHVIRTNGHPVQEDALVYRFRAIGIGGREPFDSARLDEATRRGIAAGFADAMATIRSSRAQMGEATGTGWNKIEKARYGFNYLSRAAINYVGLGANVSVENYSFNTFVDSAGAALDGSVAAYSLTLAPPPPVHAFWSVTVYDARTMALYPNMLQRYLINDRTRGLKADRTGSIRLDIRHRQPKDSSNWLPVPDGPFYLVVRAYLPKPEMLEGKWRPEGVVAMPLRDGKGRD